MMQTEQPPPRDQQRCGECRWWLLDERPDGTIALDCCAPQDWDCDLSWERVLAARQQEARALDWDTRARANQADQWLAKHDTDGTTGTSGISDKTTS